MPYNKQPQYARFIFLTEDTYIHTHTSATKTAKAPAEIAAGVAMQKIPGLSYLTTMPPFFDPWTVSVSVSVSAMAVARKRRRTLNQLTD